MCHDEQKAHRAVLKRELKTNGPVPFGFSQMDLSPLFFLVVETGTSDDF